MQTMPKLSSLGSSDFKKIIEENRYYVDKTTMVRAVWEGAEVQLHCRPRRFGKTLNLSMLRYFFDVEGSYKHLFEGLAVAEDTETMTQHQGKYPVISLSFKDEKADDYPAAIQGMAQLLHREWARHSALKGISKYDEKMADMSASIRSGQIREALFWSSLLELSELLHGHYGVKVILLIDEYDTPLLQAWLKGYYDKMVSFMRRLFGTGLKDNTLLYKGVLTGILRVAKESLFSGLNNFISSAGLEPDDFCDKFGFTEAEVAALLAHNGLNGREMDEVRDWYDGYRYGGIAIYNPWSILNYAFAKEPALKPHWVNTGGHDLLKRLFFNERSGIKDKLEELLRGAAITVYVDEFLTFRGLETNPDAVVSLMYFAGYLRVVGAVRRGDRMLWELSIPNREVKLAYEDTLIAWFNEDLEGALSDPLLKALTSGDSVSFGERLATFVIRVFSFYDTAEDRAEHFYHAFLLGLLARLDAQYIIRSNGESGLGRYDICLIPKDKSKKGIVMEIKAVRTNRGETLQGRLAEAREQLLAKQYDTELLAHGVTDILRLSIAVEGKRSVVEEL